MSRFRRLSDAIVDGDANSVRQLLSAGASPNEPCEYGSHPLLLAMVQFDIVKQLIDAGANVNATDSRGDTSLHQAICFRNESARKCLKLLLSAGASPNIANARGETALLRAVKYGDAVSVQELINAGASVDPVNCQPGIRLHLSILQKDWDTVKSLLEAGVPADYVNISGDTALMLAIASDQIELVQQLIDAGADVNYLDDNRGSHDGQLKSPLHDAVRACNVEIVKLLLERGADPNRAKCRWYSVLSTATRIKRNRVPILNLLLDYRADMYNDGFRSGTRCNGINDLPFEGMVETNDLEGVRLLLERGYDMNKYQAPQPAGDRPTALHVAIRIRDKNSLCSSYKDTRMLSLLLDHYRAKGTLSAELQRGQERGWSPLFCAIRSNYYKHAAVLLRAGADPNSEDGRGHTALYYALFDDNISVHYRRIQILIEYGAHLRDFIERLVDEANNEDEENSSDEEYYPIGDVESSDSETWDSDYMPGEYLDRNPREHFLERYARGTDNSMKRALCTIKYRVLYEIKNIVDDPVLTKLANSTRLKKFYESCNAEIDFLRTYLIDKSVTFYDVLMDKNFWRRVRSTDAFKNARRDLSNSTPISNRISIYIRDLKDRLATGYDKYKLWEPAIKGLARILGVNRDSYHLILSNILNCLDVEDWRSLSEIAGVSDNSHAKQ